MEESKVYELLNERDKRMDKIEKGLDTLYNIVDEINKKLGSSTGSADGTYELKKVK